MAKVSASESYEPWPIVRIVRIVRIDRRRCFSCEGSFLARVLLVLRGSLPRELAKEVAQEVAQELTQARKRHQNFLLDFI